MTGTVGGMNHVPERHFLDAQRNPEHGRLTIAVRAGGADPKLAQRAQALSLDLDMPLASGSESDHYPIVLECTPQGLALCDLRTPRLKPIRVDFDQRARGSTDSRRGPMGRALGKVVGTVVDATAGFGSDACRLVCMGYRVVAMERSPLIGALLQDAWRRCGIESKIHQRMQVMVGDAGELLPRLAPTPDVVYIDTMFPPKRKASALAKRRLRLLREIVGADQDAEALFRVAATTARHRVVVKRPKHAPPLFSGAAGSHGGKLARYDVYVTPKGQSQAALPR